MMDSSLSTSDVTAEPRSEAGSSFSVGGWEAKARQLAEEHQPVNGHAQAPTAGHKRRRPLYALLDDYARLFDEVLQRFRNTDEIDLKLAVAAEWMLDNSYIVKQALRLIAEDLPKQFYHQLPEITVGPDAGRPRVYALACYLLASENLRVDSDRIKQFITAYQERAPLTMGELWALPLMLRLVILQYLAQAVAQLTEIGVPEHLDTIGAAGQLNENEVVATGFASLRVLDAEDWNTFFEHLSLVENFLAGRDPLDVYAWMDFETRDRYRKAVEDLARRSSTSELDVARLAVRLAKQAQGYGASIGEDGRERVEPGSLDPSPNGARPARPDDRLGFSRRQTHVGYYLVDAGREQIETELSYRPPPAVWFRRFLTAHAGWLYGGSILLFTLFLTLLAAGYAAAAGADSGGFGSVGLVLLAAGLAVLPASQLVIGLLNGLVTRVLPPRVLPKMDFTPRLGSARAYGALGGIPAGFETMVVIPALLSDPADVDDLVQQLELHYLRNPDPRLGFALLTDFVDADREQLPGDEELIQGAQARIEALNVHYGSEDFRPFFFFHRSRRWNPGENAWMGWERKRGKLHEFNRLLLGDRETSYIVQSGQCEFLSRVRYVITLDSDTVLPRDAAARLVGTLAHPLNWAVFSPGSQRVAAGYTVVQPRTVVNATSANRSLFTRLFVGDVGLDLYTQAVSDVYQDLFGEGIYVGKGIYDVAAFERSLEGRVPENALLSHDLFEGIHGRVALETDIVLIEDYPPNYLVQIFRSVRWVRGDWQLLPWLLPRVPGGGAGSGGQRLPNSLSPVSRWKILDNLRRSLLMPGLFFAMLAAWLVLPGKAWVWTLGWVLALCVPLLEHLFGLVVDLLKRNVERSSPPEILLIAGRIALAFAFLPFEAYLNLKAIGRTLWRLFVTRRNLLQWTTSAQSTQEIGVQLEARHSYRSMAVAFVSGLFIGILVAELNRPALPAALPFIFAWMISPEVAYLLSRPYSATREPVEARDIERLRLVSRRTWLFFEQFIGPEDHWLPPDHFQEDPRGVVAHRTSPTNIGLALLANLAAYDLGYTGSLDLNARLGATFETLEKLERHRGHVINWFDTRSLEPLKPRYVSTVDSGNLAACLIALAFGVRQIPHSSVLRVETCQGFLDALNLVAELAAQALDGCSARSQAVRDLIRFLDDWRADLRAALSDGREAGTENAGCSPVSWRRFARQEALRLDELLTAVAEECAGTGGGDSEINPSDLRRLRLYAQRVHYHLQSARREIELLAPWGIWLSDPPEWLDRSDLPDGCRRAYEDLAASLPPSLSISNTGPAARQARQHVETLRQVAETEIPDLSLRLSIQAWCAGQDKSLEDAGMAAKALDIGFAELARRALKMVAEMDFAFLFDNQRQVFHIGYNLELGRLDKNYYDLLASEARIASLIAIGKGDVPQSHWLHLARPMTEVDSTGRRALLSWSATMFEYLMPPLLVKSYEGTLLHQSEEAAIDRQMDYAREHNVPWGVSESGYYRFDNDQNYQYRAFGVPGLGFKRGLGDDLVVAPYASLLAVGRRPHSVSANLAALEELGMEGVYGYYEAVDFTAKRLARGERYRIVKSYMAHHQGMALLALDNFLNDNVMVRRFHMDGRIQSVELLLQEQLQRRAPIQQPHSDEGRVVRPGQEQIVTHPWQVPVNAPQPRAHILSNGRYSVLVTSSGTGYSRWSGERVGDVDLTRWRSDTTLNPWGSFIYVQDLEQGDYWSAAHQPVGIWHESRTVQFSPHMVEFRRREKDISLVLELVVPVEEDLEVRRLSLTNHGDRPRRLRVISYGEVVMAPQAADARHPAFNKLFIESEFLPERFLQLFRRRPRSSDEDALFMAHSLVLPPDLEASLQHEGDRACFLGRGRTPRRPLCLEARLPLGGTEGATLDPIFSLGQELLLPPHSTLSLAYLTGAGEDRVELLDRMARYESWSLIERAFGQAQTHAAVVMRRLGLTVDLLKQVENLFSALVFPHAALRADPATLAANRKGQPGLWSYSISGDYPILLVKIEAQEDLALLQDVLRAHAYWRNRGVKIDLAILNERGHDYGQELNAQIHRLLSTMEADPWINRRGGIFLLFGDQLGEADRILLETVARAILDGGAGSLADQLEALNQAPTRLPAFSGVLSAEAEEETPPLPRPVDLQFDNGYGGFSSHGLEYVVFLEPGQWTPLPWTNVIANADFGCLATESGGGYTWAVNSGENRLTPWSNDPVSDPPGEALYLRDEETAIFWSPQPLPRRAPAPYLVRHGPGYTTWAHHSHGLKQRVRTFVAPDAPVKVIQLRLENTWARVRRITATYYAEWVLGVNPADSKLTVVPEYDDETQALLARNPYNVEFGERVAFAAASVNLHGLTADRTEFIGRNGSLERPLALTRVGLASTVRPGVDPCAALQLHIDLQPGEVKEVYFLLGQGASRQDALTLAARFKQPDEVEQAWQEVRRFWRTTLQTVQVETPEPAMDQILNGWLLYQALACRIWGRSAFYQSSGAYGFRDQLQDVMAVLYTHPQIAREHLLRAARHQFEAGDVLHWWHPPSGRGVRTRISDDLLWLPYVTAHYVLSTGDESVLSERVPFKRGPMLEPEQEERYGFYEDTTQEYTLFEHCRRALDQGATFGPHGLPLFGSGDWNDGMNRVGIEGRGESVWLGWFLYATLQEFARLCERRGEAAQSDVYRDLAEKYRRALEEHAWDGDWYLRGYYDDGAPLGSAESLECQIDAIAQSWGLISGGAGSERAARAMQSVYERLVRLDDGLLLLFTPPFDETHRDPGYIKGYLPGIRENGGQYTHAAIWSVWAYTLLGAGRRALELFQTLNPVNHSASRPEADRYKVEPYVVAADVYGVSPHTGRGGWTWYTGSSGWLYRLGLEAILGLGLRDGRVVVDPCIPPDWSGYSLRLQNGDTKLVIQVENPDGVSRGVRAVYLDGRPLPDRLIPLPEDGQEHQVRVILGSD